MICPYLRNVSEGLVPVVGLDRILQTKIKSTDDSKAKLYTAHIALCLTVG